MELHAENVTLFQHGSIGNVIRADGAGVLALRRVVAVGEINVRIWPKTEQQFRFAAQLKLIPAHVGHARVRWKPAHDAFEDTEAAHFRRLFAGIEERLQTETN